MKFAICNHEHVNMLDDDVYRDQLNHFICSGCNSPLEKFIGNISNVNAFFEPTRTFPTSFSFTHSMSTSAHSPMHYGSQNTMTPTFHQSLSSHGYSAWPTASSSSSAPQNFAMPGSSATGSVPVYTMGYEDEGYKPPRSEAVSQEELYKVLGEAGYLFLCEDDLFRDYDHILLVKEPLVYGGQFHKREGKIVSRLGTDPVKLQGSSYPDYVVKNPSGEICMIELKTPSASSQSLLNYLSSAFEDNPNNAHLIINQIERRHAAMPKKIEGRNTKTVILFDVSLLESRASYTKIQTAFKDLNTHIKNSDKSGWWRKNIHEVIFYAKGQKLAPYTIEQVSNPNATVANTKPASGKSISAFFQPAKNTEGQ